MGLGESESGGLEGGGVVGLEGGGIEELEGGRDILEGWKAGGSRVGAVRCTPHRRSGGSPSRT